MKGNTQSTRTPPHSCFYHSRAHSHVSACSCSPRPAAAIQAAAALRSRRSAHGQGLTVYTARGLRPDRSGRAVRRLRPLAPDFGETQIRRPGCPPRRRRLGPRAAESFPSSARRAAVTVLPAADSDFGSQAVRNAHRRYPGARPRARPGVSGPPPTRFRGGFKFEPLQPNRLAWWRSGLALPGPPGPGRDCGRRLARRGAPRLKSHDHWQGSVSCRMVIQAQKVQPDTEVLALSHIYAEPKSGRRR